MSYVTIVRHQKIHYTDVAPEIVENCDESGFLAILADENDIIASNTEDESEKAFAVAAARRLRELAKWFEDNQP